MKPSAFCVAVLITALPPAGARNIYVPTYDELFAKSDFVVIARPITATRDTPEHNAIRDIGDPPLPVIGVITDFEAIFVIKGPKRKRFTLHHYRWAPVKKDVVMVNGPAFVSYDAKPIQPTLLMFLTRERDGRFAPTAGQTDPAAVSIHVIEGL